MSNVSFKFTLKAENNCFLSEIQQSGIEMGDRERKADFPMGKYSCFYSPNVLCFVVGRVEEEKELKVTTCEINTFLNFNLGDNKKLVHNL